jgi:excinuclease ABC subunit C
MDESPTPAAHERLTLVGLPSERKSPEEFLAAFDVSSVPSSPGCYLMHDEHDKVIYVGKAKNLRNRIRTYINDQDGRYSVKFLMRRVVHIDFFLTSNEKEAVLLENSLIKQFKPRYNVQLKDDKTYVSLRIDPNEDFPRLTVTRRVRKDGAQYFGPYESAGTVRGTLRQIHRIFPLRTCTDHVMNNRARPCIYYQMKQCGAPCVGLVSREEYHQIADQVVLALSGRSGELEALLGRQIRERADALKFEEAAVLRDRMHGLERMLERQRTVNVPGAEDRDVVGCYSQGRFTEIQLLFYRGGKMVGGRSYSFKQQEMPVSEVLSSFLLQYYSEAPVIPAEVLVPEPIEEAETLAEILTEQRGSKVAVHCPQRGEKTALVELASRNAQSSFEEKRLAARAQTDLLDQVRIQLKLATTPNRIECFDISTHQGDRTVGSMVVFEGGEPNKNRYRRYAIKSFEGQDDFASLREVLMRRFTRAIAEGDLPDLVLIDGGKGQLGVATAVLKDLGIEDLDAASIAKSRAVEGGHSPERFFVPGRANPIILPQNSAVVHLLARVRDEAHRFAITYHRERRQKATLRTSLTEIPGVGPVLARRLLNKFGSIARMGVLSADEIAEVSGVSPRLAEAIQRQLAARGPADTSGVTE